MNEMKELEAQLRSWEPRRPSSRIERKLFRRQRREEAPVVAPYAWLAPVTAALLLGCLVFNQHGGSPSAMATNSSAGCIAARTVFSISEVSTAAAGFLTRHGTG